MQVKTMRVGEADNIQQVRYVILPCLNVNVGCYIDESGNIFHCSEHWRSGEDPQQQHNLRTARQMLAQN